MDFKLFFEKCQNEATISDFESYLASCIFEKSVSGKPSLSLEEYSRLRDRAFEHCDEDAAKKLFELAGANKWKEGEWEGALR